LGYTLGDFFSKTHLVTLELCDNCRNGNCGNQGDKVGRIFADWAIAYYEQYYDNYRNSPNFWATFFYRRTIKIKK
jgi:hypothetical protein